MHHLFSPFGSAEKNVCSTYIVFFFPNPLATSTCLYNFVSFDFMCLSICACRQQDEELDELSASVERIGGVGLTIHEELLAQVRIL